MFTRVFGYFFYFKLKYFVWLNNYFNYALNMHPTTQLLENARERVTFPIEELTKLIYVNEEIYETFMKA